MRLPVAALAASFVFFAAAACAEKVTEPGYAAVFPCQTQLAKQIVAAGKMKIPIATRSCSKDGLVYFAIAGDFPKGFIARKTLRAALADSVGGAAANVKGTIRMEKPYALGRLTGRDVLIDVKSKNAAIHLRVFFIGDRQIQAMVVAPKGRESDKAALAFLGSFKPGK